LGGALSVIISAVILGSRGIGFTRVGLCPAHPFRSLGSLKDRLRARFMIARHH